MPDLWMKDMLNWEMYSRNLAQKPVGSFMFLACVKLRLSVIAGNQKRSKM